MPKVTRRYSVDLREPADERWADMIRAESTRGRRVIRACMEHFEDTVGSVAVAAARLLLPAIHHVCGDNFGDDVDAWYDGADIKRNDLILANLSYELAQLTVFKSILGKLNPFGCTAAAYNLPKGEAGIVTAHWPPSFALRHIFERCDDFDDAVSTLRKYKLAASALFMVVGTKPDEAVVIEHTGDSAACRWMKDGALAVSNHYVSKKNYEYNGDDDVSADDDEYASGSETRLNRALDVAAKKAAPTASTLRDSFLCNETTVQQMAFVAKTGTCSAVWRNK